MGARHAFPAAAHNEGGSRRGSRIGSIKPCCRDGVQGKCKTGNSRDKWHPPRCNMYKMGNCNRGSECNGLHSNMGFASPANQEQHAGGNEGGIVFLCAVEFTAALAAYNSSGSHSAESSDDSYVFALVSRANKEFMFLNTGITLFQSIISSQPPSRQYMGE